jgi:hypothetical protein
MVNWSCIQEPVSSFSIRKPPALWRLLTLMKITDLTSIGRLLDPRYPTNRAIALLAMAVGAVGTVSRLLIGLDLISSIQWGTSAGFAVFFAWALARELDPDHELSAFVAAGLMLLGLLPFELPALLPLLWMLVLLRIINRTAGPPAKIWDSLLLLGLGGWLAWQGTWIYGLMTAVAFFLDGRMSLPQRRQLLFAGIALLGTGVLFAVNGGLVGAGGLSLPTIAVIIATCVLYVGVILSSRDLMTVGDATGQPLDPRRIQAGQVLALLTAVQVAWWGGMAGVVGLMPLWAAILGVALYRLTTVASRVLHKGG